MKLFFEIRYNYNGKRYRYISDSVDFYDLCCRLQKCEIEKLTIKSLWV